MMTTSSLLATPLMPFVGAALAGGAAYLLAKYLSKAKTDRGKQITENLESAKLLYGEYLERYENGDIDNDRVKVLIDRLYRKLLSEVNVI